MTFHLLPLCREGALPVTAHHCPRQSALGGHTVDYRLPRAGVWRMPEWIICLERDEIPLHGPSNRLDGRRIASLSARQDVKSEEIPPSLQRLPRGGSSAAHDT